MKGHKGVVAISKLVKHSSMLEDFRCSSTMIGSDEDKGVVYSISHLKYAPT